MESESHEEAVDEEIDNGAAGNESDMDLDLLAESDSDSEESQVKELCAVLTFYRLVNSTGSLHSIYAMPQFLMCVPCSFSIFFLTLSVKIPEG